MKPSVDSKLWLYTFKSNWNLFQLQVDTDTLASCIRDCINSLLNRLEIKHGNIFVAHSLAYLTVSRGGISESELDDVLSLDDEVLNSVYTHWESPVRRIPPNMWTRYKSKI